MNISSGMRAVYPFSDKSSTLLTLAIEGPGPDEPASRSETQRSREFKVEVTVDASDYAGLTSM